MQSAGLATCHPLNQHPIVPCPDEVIRNMIFDGTLGQELDASLTEALQFYGEREDEDGVERYYKAARRYNSGAMITTPDLGVGSTNCYASDVANWLVGGMYRNGRSGCAYRNENKSTEDDDNAGSNSHNATPDTKGRTVKGEPDGDVGIWDRGITGAAANCKVWYVPARGETCEDVPLDSGMLLQLNVLLKGDCTNLWASYAYCVLV